MDQRKGGDSHVLTNKQDLVGGLEHVSLCFHILGIVIPTD